MTANNPNDKTDQVEAAVNAVVVQIAVLNIQPNDIVMLQLPLEMPHEFNKRFTEQLKEHFTSLRQQGKIPPCSIVYAPPGTKYQVLRPDWAAELQCACEAMGYQICDMDPQACEHCNAFAQLYYRGPEDAATYKCGQCVLDEYRQNLQLEAVLNQPPEKPL